VIVLLGVVFAYTHYFDGGVIKSREAWGQFGDYLGGTLNPILSFFTISILVIATRLQKKELVEARAGICASNDALQRQCEILANQAMEQTFFRLLEDFKSDIVVQECIEKQKRINVGIYKLWRERDNNDFNLRHALEGIVSAGSFVQVFSTKLDIILSVIMKLESKEIYLKLVQSYVGPYLTAAVCQYYFIMSKPKYIRMKETEIFMQGISIELFYAEEVVADFLKKHLSKFKEMKEVIIEKFEKESIV
jgi:hypothetical protein